MTLPLYYIQPSTTPSSVADFRLDSYLLHVRTQHCCCCGRDHLSSQLFEVHINPRMTGHSGAHRLIAVHDKVRGGYRIGISHLRPEETIVCHECITSSDLVDPTPVSQEQWKSDLQHRFVGFGATETAPKERRDSAPTHPRNPTIKDL
jgi:hypothetical protein